MAVGDRPDSWPDFAAEKLHVFHVARSAADHSRAETAHRQATRHHYRWVVRTGVAWLGSRVVSVLDSGAEGPGSNRSRDAVG